jgi:hypothetical protein
MSLGWYSILSFLNNCHNFLTIPTSISSVFIVEKYSRTSATVCISTSQTFSSVNIAECVLTGLDGTDETLNFFFFGEAWKSALLLYRNNFEGDLGRE